MQIKYVVEDSQKKEKEKNIILDQNNIEDIYALLNSSISSYRRLYNNEAKLNLYKEEFYKLVKYGVLLPTVITIPILYSLDPSMSSFILPSIVGASGTLAMIWTFEHTKKEDEKFYNKCKNYANIIENYATLKNWDLPIHAYTYDKLKSIDINEFKIKHKKENKIRETINNLKQKKKELLVLQNNSCSEIVREKNKQYIKEYNKK